MEDKRGDVNEWVCEQSSMKLVTQRGGCGHQIKYQFLDCIINKYHNSNKSKEYYVSSKTYS